MAFRYCSVRLQLNPRQSAWEDVKDVRDELRSSVGAGDLTWNDLVVTFSDANGSSRFFLSVNTWDHFKRKVTRDVLHKLRQSFYQGLQKR